MLKAVGEETILAKAVPENLKNATENKAFGPPGIKILNSILKDFRAI